MPEVSRFFGIVIRMYFNEHNPPHFHAQYGKFNAVFDIETGIKTKGEFPKIGERIVTKWAKQYKKDLLENWKMMSTKKVFRKIKGADR